MILNKPCVKLQKQFRKNNSAGKAPEKISKASFKVKE
jgi:hypothetical protein